MSRRHDHKMGCLELAVVAFGLFLAFQFLVLGVQVVAELVALVGTLVRWVVMGLAGVVAVAAVAAAVAGIGYGMKKLSAKFVGRPATGESTPLPRVPYSGQAREWQRGINITVGRLRQHGWLRRQDAKRYRQSVEAAIERIRSLEHDIKTLRGLRASAEFAHDLEKVAQTLVSRLERTHCALARLLAESALERAPLVDAKLREATEELESLVAALAEVGAASGSSTATVFSDGAGAEEVPRPKAAVVTDETWGQSADLGYPASTPRSTLTR